VKRLGTVLLVVLLGNLAACHNSGSASGSVTGATSAEGAVNAFLAAAKARDLQALSAVWGTARGSVRETMDRTSMETRGTIIMGLLCPDESHVTGWSAGTGAQRNVRAQMKRGTKVIDVEFVTIPGPAKRWYVQDFPVNGDLPQRLQAFCR
jgi:hypothetical protein